MKTSASKWSVLFAVLSLSLVILMFVVKDAVFVMYSGRIAAVLASVSYVLCAIGSKKPRFDALALLLVWLFVLFVGTPILMSAIAAAGRSNAMRAMRQSH